MSRTDSKKYGGVFKIASSLLNSALDRRVPGNSEVRLEAGFDGIDGGFFRDAHWQVFELDVLGVVVHQRVIDGVLKLAHVAGPIVPDHVLECFR